MDYNKIDGGTMMFVDGITLLPVWLFLFDVNIKVLTMVDNGIILSNNEKKGKEIIIAPKMSYLT